MAGTGGKQLIVRNLVTEIPGTDQLIKKSS